MQVAHHYWENGIAYFTRRINKCISYSTCAAALSLSATLTGLQRAPTARSRRSSDTMHSSDGLLFRMLLSSTRLME